MSGSVNRIVKRSAGRLIWSEEPPLVNILGQSPDFVRYRRSLPIHKFREQILHQIEQQQVVIIAGSTGCGKTTQVPQYILEQAYEKKVSCKIICIHPRSLSAIAAADRVAAERGICIVIIILYAG